MTNKDCIGDMQFVNFTYSLVPVNNEVHEGKERGGAMDTTIRTSHYKTSNTKEANFWRLMYRMFWCARKRDALKAGYIMTSMRTAWIDRNRAALITARQKMRELASF